MTRRNQGKNAWSAHDWAEACVVAVAMPIVNVCDCEACQVRALMVARVWQAIVVRGVNTGPTGPWKWSWTWH